METREKFKWVFLLSARALLGTLDLLSVLSIAFVATSSAIFISEGSDPKRTISFAGFVLPAVNASTLPLFLISIFMLLIAKACFSILLQRSTALFLAKIEARSALQISRISFSGNLIQSRQLSEEQIAYALQISSPTAFNGVLNYFAVLVSEGFLFLLISITLFIFNPILTLFALVYFSLVAAAIQFFIGRQLANASSTLAVTSIKATALISDLFRVFRELTALGFKEKYISSIYRARVDASSSIAKQNYISGMPRHIIETSLILALGALIAFSGESGDFLGSAGTLGAFLSGGFRLTAAMLPLQNAILGIKNDSPTARYALEIVSSEIPYAPEIGFGEFSDSAHNKKPFQVEFQDVSFRYGIEENFAIDSISMEIEAGSQIAVIGISGAGKSTLADLLAGILNPTTGSILIDGHAPSNLTVIQPGSIGYVPQHPGLVRGTLAENIALGRSANEADRKKMQEVASLAALDSVLEKLPQGLDSDLGLHRDLLSGGEIQRLGLARALYNEPGLLILDEATSALDASSESLVARALAKFRGKITVVIIAHRLHTIQTADMVYLLDKGRLIDKGEFKDLIKRNSSVQNFVNLLRIAEHDPETGS